MQYLNVVLSSIFSIVALFILTKIMGRRQVSQLSMFDYINGITIGSIAAEMATALEDDMFLPLIALVIYAGIATLISYLSCKSNKLRRFVVGKPLVLFDGGKIYEKNLKRAKLDIGEFMSECRTSGYFNLKDIETAVYEPNGKLSFVPISSKRPSNPSDFGIFPQQEREGVAVIVDGKVLKDNLKHAGKDMSWLNNQLKSNKTNVGDTFFAYIDITCDKLESFNRTNLKLEKHIFE